METGYLDTEKYSSLNLAGLNSIENQIPTTGTVCGQSTMPTVGQAGTGACASATPNDNDYCVGVTSASTNSFQIHRSSTGTISRTCVVPSGNNRGGCMTGNTW
jgi:hypothetical protein